MVQGQGKSKIPSSPGGTSVGGQDESLSRSIDSIDDGPCVERNGSVDMTSLTSEEKEGIDPGERVGYSSNGTAARKTEETEIPASVLKFFDLNHSDMLGKGVDESDGSASLKADKRQSACGQNATGRQECGVITAQVSKRSRPRHATLANKGTIEKSPSGFCWRSMTYDCGCEECDPESELDEEETELVSEVCLASKHSANPSSRAWSNTSALHMNTLPSFQWLRLIQLHSFLL